MERHDLYHGELVVKWSAKLLEWQHGDTRGQRVTNGTEKATRQMPSGRYDEVSIFKGGNLLQDLSFVNFHNSRYKVT